MASEKVFYQPGKVDGTFDNRKSYMAQPNVIAFNMAVKDKMFDNLKKNKGGNGKMAFSSVETLEKEIDEFMQLCYSTQTVPTITGLALWLGVSRDTIYAHAANKNSPFSDTLEQTIVFTKLSLENGAVEGKVSPNIYSFLSKNYYGMKDQQEITLKPSTDQPNTQETYNAIKTQLIEQDTTKDS